MEDSSRLRRSRDAGPYFGLSPRRDPSGSIEKQLGISKHGDGLVRTLLVQCARRILGPFGKDCALRRHGLTLAARGGPAAKKRAVIAVARKLAVLLHRLCATGEAYVPLRGAKSAYSLRRTDDSVRPLGPFCAPVRGPAAHAACGRRGACGRSGAAA